MADEERISYELNVNGQTRAVAGAWYFESLLFVLREQLGLTGPKYGCGHGSCGACTVLVDGEPTCSCLLLAGAAQGSEITTVEGLTPDDGLSDLQQALVEAGAVQCGFCTPGFVVAATSFLEEHPGASEDEVRRHLYGNVCRCTGYVKIVDAVVAVAARRAEGPADA